jgi:methylthioribose-1-phosphate isomerase
MSIEAPIEPLIWRDNALHLLDQRQLPQTVHYQVLHTPAEVATAIHNMSVRGAPAIGIAAAYGLVLAHLRGEDWQAATQILAASRPTAVNLHWALQRMQAHQANPLAEAVHIHQEDLAQNQRMAELGAALLPPNAKVLTHCNTGALATGGIGTALGVIRHAWKTGQLHTAFHTETRPWWQGARLTAWELQQEGIRSQMIVDGAAAHLIRKEKIDWVIVGADRIAANGDTANKIGTFALALQARALGAKFMVVAPSGTFDLACDSGAHIPIEDRGAAEITTFKGHSIAPEGYPALNPVFDVTPAEYIDAIVCERGVILAPTRDKVLNLLG